MRQLRKPDTKTEYINKMKQLFYFLILLITIKSLGQIPQSGIYNELILVRNETNKTIDGYFNSSTGNGQISCIYEFKGTFKTLNDKKISVTAFWQDDDEIITGELICKEGNKFLLKFSEPLLGDMACGGVSQSGAEFEMTKQKNWKEIRIVKTEKTYFYKESKISTKRKAYITDLDAVGVIKEKGEWLLVDFNGSKLTTGWIKKSDLYKKK